MSRPTATQVIERGEYLEPDFDPATLTIPHLLSVFTLHHINYPTPHNKSKLVQVFYEEVAPRAARFKRERIKMESSAASSQGITDGMTGRSLSDDDPQEQPPPRRYSRRLSRPPSQTPPPTMPEPPKRRRSSAGPSLSRAPSKISEPQQQPPLLEESEPEDEPAKKVGRPRKSAAAAGPQGRRVSQSDDVEGWSDNNVFQSGAESSSPARPSPNIKTSVVVRRGTRHGRTSVSAPPQIPSSSPLGVPPTSPTFDPRLPAVANVTRRALRSTQGQGSPSDALGASRRRIFKVEQRSSSPVPEEEEEEDALAEGQDNDLQAEAEAKFTSEVSQALASGGSRRAVARRNTVDAQQVPIWTRFVFGMIALALAGITGSYKVDSASIGYCHPGTTTNPILGERQVTRMAAQECTERLAQQSSDDPVFHNNSCTPLPLVPLPEPMTCTPCPAHAYCTPHTVTCEQSFVLRQHPLAQIPYLPELLNGLPGFGPVALPPSCVEDEERRKNIGRLGVALENYLALTKGHRLCIGLVKPSDDGGEAAQWGLDVARVHDHLQKVTVVQKKVVKEAEFESLFKQAIADLHRYGYVTMDQDSNGDTYIAAMRTHLDLPCKIRVAGRDAWNQWKAHVFASILLLVSAYWTKGKIATRQIESRRVGDLVQLALDTLHNQEIAHHTDPVTAPHAYLSSLHLRDLILQDEHSIPTRRRLWDKVQKVVEGNTNVRASMEELAGGDEGRVWRWVGGAHRKTIKSP